MFAGVLTMGLSSLGWEANPQIPHAQGADLDQSLAPCSDAVPNLTFLRCLLSSLVRMVRLSMKVVETMAAVVSARTNTIAL